MISVIVPVYNVKPYIGKCLSSVKRQTYRDWECIVVDDGSTDGSAESLEIITQGDKRFTVLHYENAGLRPGYLLRLLGLGCPFERVLTWGATCALMTWVGAGLLVAFLPTDLGALDVDLLFIRIYIELNILPFIPSSGLVLFIGVSTSKNITPP